MFGFSQTPPTALPFPLDHCFFALFSIDVSFSFLLWSPCQFVLRMTFVFSVRFLAFPLLFLRLSCAGFEGNPRIAIRGPVNRSSFFVPCLLSQSVLS